MDLLTAAWVGQAMLTWLLKSVSLRFTAFNMGRVMVAQPRQHVFVVAIVGFMTVRVFVRNIKGNMRAQHQVTVTRRLGVDTRLIRHFNVRGAV